MAELVDALDLESSGRPWGFESLIPDQIDDRLLVQCTGSFSFFVITESLICILFMIKAIVNKGNHPERRSFYFAGIMK